MNFFFFFLIPSRQSAANPSLLILAPKWKLNVPYVMVKTGLDPVTPGAIASPEEESA